MLTFSIIPRQWDGSVSWHPSSWKTRSRVKHHGRWWPGDTRSQGIGDYGIDLAVVEYSGKFISLNMHRKENEKWTPHACSYIMFNVWSDDVCCSRLRYLADLLGSRCDILDVIFAFMLRNKHVNFMKWKHFPRYWPFVWGIHRSPMNSPHKGHWREALMFSLICVWINGWVNNHQVGELRHHLAHYDVTVMKNFSSTHIDWPMVWITKQILDKIMVRGRFDWSQQWWSKIPKKNQPHIGEIYPS